MLPGEMPLPRRTHGRRRAELQLLFPHGRDQDEPGRGRHHEKCGLYDTTPLKRPVPKPFIVSAVSPPERKGRKYNWKEFRALWDEGKTDGEIAKEMRCSKDTVANWRHAEGLDFRRRRAPITRSELLEDWQAGMSDPKIAAKHGVSPMTVNRLRREMGLEAGGGKK